MHVDSAERYTLKMKLKSCPFCGNKPAIRRCVEEYEADEQHPAGEYDAWFFIECDHCAIKIGEEYRSEAIKLWNTRKGKKKS